MSREYDLKTGRQRIDDLVMMRRRLMHTQQPNGTWDWFLEQEIAAIEAEMAEAKSKMTAWRGDHFEVEQLLRLFPVYTPEQAAASAAL
ncbi:hypothetical protein ACFFSY_13675 [Paenibacillus aurantiacus]|uniref:Uncharacterized protein n=1 Tax=Paenibacillus aurantiacus TaxID=1936118 RepID=A0ABV5KP26_9BACL